MLVFGTRPEAIKMAPLVKEFQKFPKEFETIVCVTGQHREMLDQVLRIFEIRPDYDLDIMQQGQDLYDVTARVLTGMRDVLKEAQPDVVLVHGDTTTSTASALAAFYQQIPVGHIEAGLRTHNIYSPWPEEMNRLITGRIATYHFSPTPLSRQNLLAEGIKEEAITVTGNTVIDALYWVVEKIKNNKVLSVELGSFLKTAGYDVNRLNDNRRLVLITGHRRENFGDGFIHMCLAIKNLVEKYPQVDFVYPMHLNPNVRKPIHEVFGETTADNMFFIEPLEYLSFVYLMEKSTLVLTDSGGIQEEAPGLGKPVLVMRDTTERPEALEAGTVKLVGTDYDKIVSEVSALLDDPMYYDRMSKAVNPYGDGKACGRIMEFLNKEMSNVVLSIDGRKEVHDRMRPFRGGQGSYDLIVPKFQKLAESRHQTNYYVRGTFTHNNLDFSEDVKHLADLGFEQISVEPVVTDPKEPYALRPEDVPQLLEEYDKLAVELLKRQKEGRGVNFFHFMIDLSGGPCVAKRLSGCGSGTEYLAVTPWGDFYPCHQFVGNEKFLMGNVDEGIVRPDIVDEFKCCNVYAKEKCRSCFAKFYCSGGCAANSYNCHGKIDDVYELGCELQKKRVECAIMIKAALADEEE